MPSGSLLSTPSADAPRLLLRAARRLEPLHAAQARETHLEALLAAICAGDLHVTAGIPEAARAAPSAPEAPGAVDVLLDAVALRFTDGYVTAAPTLTRALRLLDLEAGVGEASLQPWLAELGPAKPARLSQVWCR